MTRASLTRAAFIGLTSLTMAMGGCEGRPRPEEGPKTEPPKKRGPAIAVMDLSGGAPEQEKGGLFGSSGPKKSFDEAVRVMKELAEDTSSDHSLAVAVKLGSARFGAARGEELADALATLKSKKKVVCHADGFANLSLMIAAKGCSSIWLSPAGGIDAVGLAAQIVYMRRLLADELHLSIDFLQVGKFKGAEEPLTRDGPSPEARASLMSVLTDMRGSWLGTLSAARPKAVADTVEDGPYAPPRAKELGLIDEVGYADDMIQATKTAVNAVRERVVFGPGAEPPGADLDELVRAIAGENEESAPVALVRATGSISMSGGDGLFGGRGGITEKDLNRTIMKLEKDDDVKAVVLRIDSPGGSALASDLIWHQLMKLRKKKPLVVSVGEMAASGGYYLACTGDFIFADAMSILGSIGVVGGKIGVGDALEKIGVHTETFPASPKPGAAARSAYESPLARWDDATKVRVLETMTGIYELFLSRVSEGRSTRGRTISREKIAESAEGRIFSGREAQTRGLVDELGGLGAALAKARSLAKLNADARVAVVGGKSGLLDGLDLGGGSEERTQVIGMTSVVDRIAPDVLPFVTSLAPLMEGERMVLAMPYALKVR